MCSGVQKKHTVLPAINVSLEYTVKLDALTLFPLWAPGFIFLLCPLHA